MSTIEAGYNSTLPATPRNDTESALQQQLSALRSRGEENAANLSAAAQALSTFSKSSSSALWVHPISSTQATIVDPTLQFQANASVIVSLGANSTTTQVTYNSAGELIPVNSPATHGPIASAINHARHLHREGVVFLYNPQTDDSSPELINTYT